MEGIREKKQITYKNLRVFNGVMGGIHLASGIFMLIATFVVEGVKDFKLDISTDFRFFDAGPPPDLVPAYTLYENVIPLAILPAIFLFLSAIAHFLIVLPGLNDFYNRKLEEGINYFRWFEYAISSSVMIFAIALLFGVYNIAALIAIVSLNATMNLMGLMMEKHNLTTEKTDWTAFIIGTFAGIIPWIIILIYLVGSGDIAEIPGFVWGIIGGYFFFFWTFPVNMILQYAKVWKWEDYLFGERGYIILSLVSKSVLAWTVFGGTFQPSG
jgi:hypothetical protein